MRATRILAFTIGVVLANQWSDAIDPSRVQAQAAASTRVAFEVASVKPNKSGEPRVMIRTEPGGRFTATNVPLRVLIRNAYGISEDSQIVDAPGWIGSERFDVVARAPGDVPPLVPGDAIGPMNRMLQALLEDRFRLKRTPRNEGTPCLRPRCRSRRQKARAASDADESRLRGRPGQTLSAERACRSVSTLCAWPAPSVRIDRRRRSDPGAGDDDCPARRESVRPSESGRGGQDRARRKFRHQSRMDAGSIPRTWAARCAARCPTPIVRFIGPVDLYRAAGAARSQAGLGEGVNRRPRHRSRRTTHARLIEIRRRLLQFRDEVESCSIQSGILVFARYSSITLP